MKSKFPGYFKPNKKDIKALWDNAIFTFDTNILLNLYRYSDETREEFYKIFEKLKDKIWISYQSAFEFLDNRLTVISQQEKSYEDMISNLNSLEEKFKNIRQHPFISDSLLNRFSSLITEICTELSGSKKFHNNRISDDEILNNIEEFFNEKVGEEYNSEDLEKLLKEGEERFKLKIPPGYKDTGKKETLDQNIKQYGDLIVWKQIIDQAKKSSKSIILVTDDRKEDWWVRFNGKTIQPRPELIKEFKNETKQEFYMYHSDRFLEFAKEQLNQDINHKAISEIRELRKLDEEKRISNLRDLKNNEKLKHLKNINNHNSNLIKSHLESIQKQKPYLLDAIKEQALILSNSDPASFDDHKLENLRTEFNKIENTENLYKLRLEELELELKMINDDL